MGAGRPFANEPRRETRARAALAVVLGACVHCGDPADREVARPAGDAGVFGFQRDVYPIFVNHCGECHSVNGPYHDIASPDLAQAYSDAVEYAERVVARIRQGNMPPACVFDGAACVPAESLLVIERWMAADFPE